MLDLMCDSMKLIVLGSGTCVPSLNRNAPGYYLEAGDRRILLDCGSGTLLQLERAGKSYRDIDAVFITHTHPDHFADLMPLIHALRATPGFKRAKTLFIVAPSLFIEYYDRAIATVLGRPREFSIQRIRMPEEMDFRPFNVRAAKTVHSQDSIAYRFEYGGRAIVFTGDADYDKGIVDLSRDADLLIADCSFPDANKARGHLSARQCGLVAREAGVKKLLLSHIYPADTPDIDRVREGREEFGGEVVLAEDLMEISI
ncbi:MAG: MBL fold metallo-hydrolase [Deferribacteres bacterium]|nr:MBL fold metallo-hydrolase [Deferribacteres bacterium]